MYASLQTLSNSDNMACLHVRGDNPQTFEYPLCIWCFVSLPVLL